MFANNLTIICKCCAHLKVRPEINQWQVNKFFHLLDSNGFTSNVRKGNHRLKNHSETIH